MRTGRILCLQALVLAGMLSSFVRLCHTGSRYEEARTEYKNIAEAAKAAERSNASGLKSVEAGGQMPEKAVPSELLPEKDTVYLSSINPDYTAWLTIPGTNVDYPVVHGSDNEYYLTHSFTGRQDDCGSIFLDSDIQSIWDRHIVLYGHNRKDGSMLGGLKRYLDEAFCQEHSLIYLEIEGQRYTYKLIGSRLLELSEFDNESEKNEEDIKIPQVYTGSDNQILTLSTCHGPDKRIIVQAVRMCYTGS